MLLGDIFFNKIIEAGTEQLDLKKTSNWHLSC